MGNLKSLLQKVNEQAAYAQGSALSIQARSALEAYRTRAAWASSAILIVVLVAAIVVIATSVYYIRDASALKLAVGGLGLSMGGALVVLRSTWKEWSYANLLLILIEDAREDQVGTLIDTLIKKL